MKKGTDHSVPNRTNSMRPTRSVCGQSGLSPFSFFTALTADLARVELLIDRAVSPTFGGSFPQAELLEPESKSVASHFGFFSRFVDPQNPEDVSAVG